MQIKQFETIYEWLRSDKLGPVKRKSASDEFEKGDKLEKRCWLLSDELSYILTLVTP